MSDHTTANTTAGGQARSVTAFFDTQAAADKARTDLIAAGLSPDTISVAGGGEDLPDSAPIQEGGFWHALKEFFIPDEDRFTYAEGLRRGGFALSVRTGEAQYDRALDILDADGAIDIDERQQAWRSDGWTGYRRDAASEVGYGGSDAGTAGFGASRAGEDGYAASGTLTDRGSSEAESRADSDRVGTGPDEPGLLNPDFRERIGSGTASMTPPTPTGAQDATVGNNAAVRDRSPAYTTAADAEDAALGSPTRSGAEAPAAARSTLGSMTAAEAAGGQQGANTAWAARRDDAIQRSRVRGYIVDPDTGDRAGNG